MLDLRHDRGTAAREAPLPFSRRLVISSTSGPERTA
jgi:hypothetical protein